jgi:NTE family protein
MIGGALAGRQVGLALSGGGTRAMAFHAGVLRYLAEAGILAS